MAGTIGYSSKISVNDGTGGAYVDFADVVNITVPSQEASTVESTHLNSPNRFREFVVGLYDAGEASFVQNYTSAAYQRANGLRGQTRSYRITFPDNLTVTFDAIMIRSEVSIGIEEIVQITNTLRVTGAPAIGTAA